MAIMGFMDGSKYDSNTGKQVSPPTTTTSKTSTSTRSSSGSSGGSSSGSSSPAPANTYSFMDGSTFDVNGNPLNKAAQDSLQRIATTSGKTVQQVSSALAGNDRDLLANIANALVGPSPSTVPQVAPVPPALPLPGPIKPPTQSILDFTKSLGVQSPQVTPAQDYAFTSEQDFYSKTGLKDFKSIQTIKKGEIPTSDLYQYSDDDSPVVYQRAKQAPTAVPGVTSINPLVGTSEAERAKQRQAEIARIKAELNAGTQGPPVYKSVEEFTKLRKEQGIVKDEEELSAIRNEANLIKQELRKFSSTQGQGVTETGRIGAITEAERNANFRLEDLAIRETAVLSRINTKNSYIDTAMKLGFQDYQVAYNAYSDAFNRNLQAIQLYNKEEDDRKQDAMTGFTTMVNLLSQSGLSSLTPELSSQLDSLALQAGLPSGAFQYALQGIARKEQIENMKIIGNDLYLWVTDPSGNPQLKLVQSLPNSGEQTSDMVEYEYAKSQGYKGTFQQWVDRNASRGGGGGTAGERIISTLQGVVNKYASQLDQQKSGSSDGYANPNTYRQAKREYIGAGGSVSEFFQVLPLEVYISPPNRKGDLLGSSSEIQTNTKSSDQQELNYLLQKSNGGKNLDALSQSERMRLLELIP